MFGLKQRSAMFGLLAVMLIGSIATAPAEAQGPFFYRRAVGNMGGGVKISAQEPEEVRGGGGETLLEGKLGGAEIVISATQVQVKGIIYNEAAQGQAKFEFAYLQPKAVKPSNCNVTFGKNNVIKIVGIQAWTWNGTKTQLDEQPVTAQKPDWFFGGQRLQGEPKELPKEAAVTSITLSGSMCAVSGTGPVTGAMVAGIKPALVGEWSTSQTAEVLENETPQHICWVGPLGLVYYQIEGGMIVLRWNALPAKLKQTTTFSTFGRQGGAAQEIALFEH